MLPLTPSTPTPFQLQTLLILFLLPLSEAFLGVLSPESLQLCYCGCLYVLNQYESLPFMSILTLENSQKLPGARSVNKLNNDTR